MDCSTQTGSVGGVHAVDGIRSSVGMLLVVSVVCVRNQSNNCDLSVTSGGCVLVVGVGGVVGCLVYGAHLDTGPFEREVLVSFLNR